MNNNPQPPNPLLEAASPAAPGPAANAVPERASHDTRNGEARSGDAMERVLTELVRDRRAERRWRSLFRLAWLLVAVALIWTVTPTRGLSTAPAGPHTALVDLRGEIQAEGLASADALMLPLRDAFSNTNARAVVLRINSPGGSPVQAGLVNDEIRRLKALHQKKVYAVVEEICASGAYYIAVAADEIYVDKASLVGSIGVLMEGFGFVDLMGKLGVERRLVTAGENKGMLDPFTPQGAREREHTQALINQIHQQFISVVKEGRGARLKATPDTFSGLFWNGEEAVRLGLADAVGSVDFVAREKVQAPDVVDYSPRENVAERLAKRFGASVGAGALMALRAMGTEPRWGAGSIPVPGR
ncbi:MAG: S49 family peptidase [Betaproteobacteria bacterium]|nr:S49 family peptidase [Betaproteobacteria bacterium]